MLIDVIFWVMAIALLIFSYRINVYLGLIQTLGVINGGIASQALANGEEIQSLYVGVLLTMLISVIYFRKIISELKGGYQKIKELSTRHYRREIFLLVLFVLPFYLLLTPSILDGGWWGQVSDRVEYMQESSSLLRGVKLTPILLAMLFFTMRGTLNVGLFLVTMIIGGVFSLYFGSKSGMIYLVAAFLIYISVIGRMNRALLIGAMSIFFVAAGTVLFFMSQLSMEAGTTIGEELLARLGSDVVGYIRIYDNYYATACSKYSVFAPVFGTLSKILPGIFHRPDHLSLGTCLASPYSNDYPYELLVPMYFEYILMYGPLLMIPVLLISLMFLYAVHKFIGLFGAYSRLPLIAYSAQAYFLMIALSSLWGGKIGNLVVSVGISLIFMMAVVGVLHLTAHVRVAPNWTPKR